MAGPFDDIENAVGGWLKNLLPSQPAQPSNPSLPSPSVDSPLNGMSPAGGDLFKPLNNPLDFIPGGTIAGNLANRAGIGKFMKDTGVTDFGQELLTKGFSDPNSPVNQQVNDPNSTLSQVASNLGPFPGMLLPGARKAMVRKSGLDENTFAGKLAEDPFGYVSNVLNAGVVNPIQVASNPEMWFAEDNTGPGTNDGHNYLRDVFVPAVKAITGEDVPHTTTYYQKYGDALDAEGKQLEQARAALTPDSSQDDINAYNSRLQAWQTKVATFQSDYNKSIDWWQNSTTSKVLSLAGQAITFPAGFQAGFVTFFPSLASNPIGTAESMYGQVQQAGLFAQKLSDPNQRDHMTSQELAANISNIAMLAGMLKGSMPRRGVRVGAHGDVSNEDVLKASQQHVPEMANPAGAPTAKVDDMIAARQAAPETPVQAQQRVNDLKVSLQEVQQQIHSERDPLEKKNLLEHASAINDEINSLKNSPPSDVSSKDLFRAEFEQKFPYNEGTFESLGEYAKAKENYSLDNPEAKQLIERFLNYPGEPAWAIDEDADRFGVKGWQKLDEAMPITEEVAPAQTSEQGIQYIEGLLNENLASIHGEPPKWLETMTKLGSYKGRKEFNWLRSRINMYRDGIWAGEDLNAAIKDGLREGWLYGTWQDLPEMRYNNVSSRAINAARDTDISKALSRESLNELSPSKRVPEVQPEQPYPDYYAPNTRVLGSNYQDLKPRPEDFNLNRRARMSTAGDVPWATTEQFRMLLNDTRFEPIRISQLRGNGWIHPDGWAIPVSGADYVAHEDLFAELGLSADVDPAKMMMDMMDAGWVSKTTQGGVVAFSVHGMSHDKIDLINQAMQADYKKGIPPYPYVVADETANTFPYRIDPQDFAANGFDIRPIIERLQRFPQLNRRGLPFGKEDLTKAIQTVKDMQYIKDIFTAMEWPPVKADKVSYGWLFGDGTGINLNEMPSKLLRHYDWLNGEHSDIWDLIGLGDANNLNVANHLMSEAGWVQVAHIYKNPGYGNIFVGDRLNDKTIKTIDNWLTGKDFTRMQLELPNGQRIIITPKSFKENDFTIAGMRPDKRLGSFSNRNTMYELSDRGGALLGLDQAMEPSKIPSDVTNLEEWVKAKSFVKARDLPETIELYHGTNNLSLDSIRKGHSKPTLQELTNNIEAAFDLPIDSVWSKLPSFPRDDLTYVDTSLSRALAYSKKRSAFLDEDILPQIWKMTHQGRGSYIAKKETFEAWKEEIKDQLNLKPVITRLEMPTAYFLIKARFNLDALAKETDNDFIFNTIFDNHDQPLRGGKFPIEYLTGIGDGMTNEIDPSLVFNKQGEQFGKQDNSKAGQIGQGDQAGQTNYRRNAPEGAPEGTTLTSIIPRSEGEAPVAVWEGVSSPTASLPERERLALDSFFGALDSAVAKADTDPRFKEWAKIYKDTVTKGWNEAMSGGYLNYINKRIGEYTSTFQKHLTRLDPDGLIKHIIFVDDPTTDAEAWFTAGIDAIHINVTHGQQAEWLRTIADKSEKIWQDTVNDTGALIPAGLPRMVKFMEDWKNATQEQIDLNAIGEEIAHAYDVDHKPVPVYLNDLLNDPEWIDHAIRSGLNQDYAMEPGMLDFRTFRESTLGLLSEWKQGRLDGQSPAFQSMLENIAEFNVNQIKRAWNIPLANFTDRIRRVYTNEAKDPSLIDEGTRIGQRRFDERIRPYIQQYIGYRETSKKQERVQTPPYTIAVQGRTDAATQLGSGSASLSGLRDAWDQRQYDQYLSGILGRDSANQENSPGQLASRQQSFGPKGGRPDEIRSIGPRDSELSPAEQEFMQQRQAHQLFIDLLKTGWQEAHPDQRWERFARALAKDPASKEFVDASRYLEKMPPKTQEAWLELSSKLFEEAMTKNKGFLPEEEFEPEALKSKPVKRAETRTPEFQAFQKDIAQAEVRLAESGEVIANMRKSGASKKDINNEVAAQSDLRAYIDALKSGKPPLEAKQLGRQAFTAKLVELNQPFEGTPLPELAEQPTKGGLVLGKKYAALGESAEFVSKRLAINGYPNPRNLKDFFEGLFSGEKAAEKVYKTFPDLTKKIIADRLGYQGIPKKQKVAPTESTQGGAAVSGTENYINPLPLVDEPGRPSLESEIAKVPEKGGFIAVRHGSTARNGGSGGQERLRGSDDVPLNDLGQKQAERLAAAFKGKNVQVIYVSPMSRAVDTAKAIGAVTGAKVVVDKNLAPWDIGEWSGKPAETHGKMLADYATNRPDEPAPGGESFNDYLRRYLPAVIGHMNEARASDGTILEVNHTRGVRVIKGYLEGGSQGLTINTRPIQTREEVGPGGIMGLQHDGQDWKIVTEASQAFAEERGTPKAEPIAKPLESPIVAAVDAIKKDVKTIDESKANIAKVKGEVPQKFEAATQLDEVAANPDHPLNALATKAIELRSALESASRLGGRSAEIIKADYAKAVQRFTSAMATQVKQEEKEAPLSAPEPVDKETFNRTAKIAIKLRKEIDAGADPDVIAEKAAKQLTMTRKEALVRLHNELQGHITNDWAPAYKDLIIGKAGQVIREAKLTNKPQRTTLPIKIDKILGTEPTKPQTTKASAAAPKKPVPARQQVKPAIIEHLKATVSKAPPKKTQPSPTPKVTKQTIENEVKDHSSKTTRQLREETKQIHEAIQLPVPNPFVEDFARAVEGLRQKGTDLPSLRAQRAKEGLEEPGMVVNTAGGGDGAEPPNTPPPSPLSGWDGPRDHARTFPELAELTDRFDIFMKENAKRVAPQRKTGHPIDQADAYIDAVGGGQYRIEGIAKEMSKVITSKEMNDRVRRGAEGDEDRRQEYLKTMQNPMEAALAEMLHAYYEATGKILSSANREVISSAVEGYITHALKFDENGMEILDRNGDPRPYSPKVKFWIERSENTTNMTIDDLVNAFGENNVETDMVKLFKSHADSYTMAMRDKELLDDLSGKYITNDPLRIHMFEEHSLRGSNNKLSDASTRGLKKQDFPYIGPPIVKKTEYNYVDHKYQDQLRAVKIGRFAKLLSNHLVYKPLADELERLGSMKEGAGVLDNAAIQLAKANSIFKAYKFGFNPVHLFNLYTDVDAMAGKGLTSVIPDTSLYKKIWGRVGNHLKGDEVWHTPVGDFKGDEAIAQIINHGGMLRREIVDAANLGGLQGFFAKNVPGFKQWHNFMWHEVAWKGHIGLSMHLADRMVQEIQDYRQSHNDPRPINEAEFYNILRLSTEYSKYAVGFIDRMDMSRDWNLIGNTLLFANNWSLMQMRMLGRATGIKYLGNLGGGNKYTDALTPMMKQVGGIDAQTLKMINSYDGTLARQMMVGSAMKLLITGTALAYIGSTIAALTGQPGAQASGPWQNFQRDPTHTFDMYIGTDPATGKDKWQHNPLYGMIQEMANYGFQAVKEARNGGDPYSVIEGPIGRYAFGKANPVLLTGFDALVNRELYSYFSGYGDRSDITADPNVVAIQRALDAKGFGWIPAGLMDRLIYATRQVAPQPAFAPNIPKGQTLNTWGDIVNALGPGKIVGIGDLLNATDSSSPEFGKLDRLISFDTQNLATYLLGSRTTQTSTAAQVAQSNQVGQAVANRAARDDQLKQMVDAAKHGDFRTVAQISQNLGLDNNQMLNALLYPPSGSGGGVTYAGPTGNQPTVQQDTLLGFTLTQGQTAQYEAIKEANTRAVVAQLQNTPEWKYGDSTTRGGMLSAIERDVMRAVSNQYAQELGLLGGDKITQGDIQALIDQSINYRGLAIVELAGNPEYTNADPLERQRMTSEYASFAQTLAWDATFGSLKGVPMDRVSQIVANTISVEEGTRQYLKGSMFYVLASADERSRMLTEYSSLARTIAKRQALGQGQGPRQNEVLRQQDMGPVISYIINVEENAKTLLHGSEYYSASDPATQKSLESKYETLARSLAFSQTPGVDPNAVVLSSLEAESAYFNLQNQFGGGNYLKLMAQQLSDMELALRQTARYSPSQVAAMQKALRQQFLAQNPTYAAYLTAKTRWQKTSTIGQIYSALNNSEYAAATDLADVPAQDSILISGTTSDPYFDPASNLGLVDLGGSALTPVDVTTPNMTTP